MYISLDCRKRTWRLYNTERKKYLKLKKKSGIDKYNPTKNFDFELSYNLFNKIQYRNFIPIVFNVLLKRLQQKETSIYIHTKSLYTSTNTKTIKFTLTDIFFVYRPAGS